MTKTYRYEITIQSPEDVAFALQVDLERLEARYRDTYPVAVESVSLSASTLIAEAPTPTGEGSKLITGGTDR